MDDKFWHVNCLSCDRCHGVLANSGASCFFKNGMILCKSDYYQLSPTCFNCNLLVTPDSFVHKIPCLPIQNSLNDRPYIYYHPACLRCWKCQNFLRKGDKYIIKPDNMGIVCLNNECASDFRISPINSEWDSVNLRQTSQITLTNSSNRDLNYFQVNH